MKSCFGDDEFTMSDMYAAIERMERRNEQTELSFDEHISWCNSYLEDVANDIGKKGLKRHLTKIFRDDSLMREAKNADDLKTFINNYIDKLQNGLIDGQIFLLVNNIIKKYGHLSLSRKNGLFLTTKIKDLYPDFFTKYYSPLLVGIEWRTKDRIEECYISPISLFEHMLDSNFPPESVRKVFDIIAKEEPTKLVYKSQNNAESTFYKFSAWASRQKDSDAVDKLVTDVVEAVSSKSSDKFGYLLDCVPRTRPSIPQFAVTHRDDKKPSKDHNWSKTLLLLQKLRESGRLDRAFHDERGNLFTSPNDIMLNSIGFLLCYLLSDKEPLSGNRKKVFDEILAIENFCPQIDYYDKHTALFYATQQHDVEIFKSIFGRIHDFKKLVYNRDEAIKILVNASENRNWGVLDFFLGKLLECQIDQEQAKSIAAEVEGSMKATVSGVDDVKITEISEKLESLKSSATSSVVPQSPSTLPLFAIEKHLSNSNWERIKSIASSFNRFGSEVSWSRYLIQHLDTHVRVAKKILKEHYKEDGQKNIKDSLIELLKNKTLTQRLLDDLIANNDVEAVKKLIPLCKENKIDINGEKLRSFVEKSPDTNLAKIYNAAYPTMSLALSKVVSSLCGGKIHNRDDQDSPILSDPQVAAESQPQALEPQPQVAAESQVQEKPIKDASKTIELLEEANSSNSDSVSDEFEGEEISDDGELLEYLLNHQEEIGFQPQGALGAMPNNLDKNVEEFRRQFSNSEKRKIPNPEMFVTDASAVSNPQSPELA